MQLTSDCLQASLEQAKTWVKELQRQANPKSVLSSAVPNGEPNLTPALSAHSIVIALAGNKVDLVRPSSGEEEGDEDEEAASPEEAAPAAAEPRSDAAEGDDAEAEPEAREQAEDEDEQEEPAAGGKPSASRREVSREEAEDYAKECGLLFFETSAKTGEGVVEVFTEIGASPFPLSSLAVGLSVLTARCVSGRLAAKKIPLDALMAQSRGPGGAARGAAGARGGQAGAAAGGVNLNENEAGKRDACAC